MKDSKQRAYLGILLSVLSLVVLVLANPIPVSLRLGSWGVGLRPLWRDNTLRVRRVVSVRGINPKAMEMGDEKRFLCFAALRYQPIQMFSSTVPVTRVNARDGMAFYDDPPVVLGSTTYFTWIQIMRQEEVMEPTPDPKSGWQVQ